MPLVTLAKAKEHLRVIHSAEDSAITDQLGAAEEMVAAFLGRNVYADQSALDAAIAAAPAALAAAGVTYETERDAADALDYGIDRAAAQARALTKYRAAAVTYERTVWGLVINKRIQTSILLTLTNLWEQRGDDESPEGMPKAARNFLWTMRIVTV